MIPNILVLATIYADCPHKFAAECKLVENTLCSLKFEK